MSHNDTEWDEYDPDTWNTGSYDTASRLRRDRATFDSSDYEPPESASSKARGILEWVVLFAVAILLAVGVRTFVLQAFKIPSPSMTPTLMVGDRILVNKLAKPLGTIDRGDVVVFKSPPALQEEDPTITDVVKRVIALPGDTVEGRGGLLYVNGAPLQENYLPPGTETVQLRKETVPEGTLWVMGDNRRRSSDSRVFGPVATDTLVGEAFLVWWPLKDFGGL